MGIGFPEHVAAQVLDCSSHFVLCPQNFCNLYFRFLLLEHLQASMVDRDNIGKDLKTTSAICTLL